MAAKKGAKPSAKSSPRRVPQPHGGFLVPGAGGGPQPGSGRPRDAVRAVMLNGLNDALPRLLELSQHPDPSIALKAAEMLAKYGLGTSNELDSRITEKKVLTRDEREARTLQLIKGGKTG